MDSFSCTLLTSVPTVTPAVPRPTTPGPDRALGRPVRHRPVFRSMKVLLQRKRAAGLHHDALHAIACGKVYVLVIAPGAVAAPMLDRHAMILRLELSDQLLHLLGLAARGDQHGVCGRHHDDVVE